MFWIKILQVFFGSAVISAPLPEPVHTQTSIDELLSYECAKSVATMLYPEDQAGPVFSVANLVFTGIEASDNSRWLIVSAGQGIYSIPLVREGVNRLRFSIPEHSSNQSREYFLGFLYDAVTRSRFFDFSAGRPPPGKEETDYAYVVPRRADQLLPHLEYRIHETAEGMLLALTEGRRERSQIVNQRAHNCEHIARKAPALGRNLKQNLDLVEQMVIGPKSIPARAIAAAGSVPLPPGRAPASIASNPKP